MTKFQDKIKRIMENKYELTEKEREDIKRIWMTEDDIQKEISDGYLERIRKHEAEDPLYKEWRRIYNGLNVTLNRAKNNKEKDYTENIKRYLKQLEEVYNMGYDPCWKKRGPVDWVSSFREGRVVEWKK